MNIFAHRAKGRWAVSLALVIFAITWLSATTAFAKTESQTKSTTHPAGYTYGPADRSVSGHRDARVAALQRELASKGVSPGAIDGFYGPKTERAVASYQRSQGLTVDGIAGVQTLTALRHGGARQTQELQTGLSQLGFSPGAVDGLYGPKTAAAVSALQKRSGLKVDGFAGPQTLSELVRLHKQSNPSASLKNGPGPSVQAPQTFATRENRQLAEGSPAVWAALAAAVAAAVLVASRYCWLRRRYDALAHRYVGLAKASDWTLNWEKRFGLDEEGSETTVALVGANQGNRARHIPSFTEVKGVGK